MFCLQDARACRRLTASPDSDAPTSPQSAPPSPQPAVTSSKQNAPSFGASHLLLEGPAITESKPDQHPAAASSSGNHAQASRVSHKNTEQIQALGTTAVFATSGAFAERTKLPSTPQNHPEKPTSIRRTAPFPEEKPASKAPIAQHARFNIFPGSPPPKDRDIRTNRYHQDQLAGSMLLSAMRAEQQKTRRQHHVQMAESTRRNAADTEAALRAALNQALEARKEAAFFREEAARAKDEAMIARKGMWLGLLVALVSVLISASSHWAYVSSGGG